MVTKNINKQPISNQIHKELKEEDKYHIHRNMFIRHADIIL